MTDFNELTPYTPEEPWSATDWGDFIDKMYSGILTHNYLETDSVGVGAVYAEDEGQRWFAVRTERGDGSTAEYRLVSLNKGEPKWFVKEGKAPVDPDNPMKVIEEASQGDTVSAGISVTKDDFMSSMSGFFC